MSCAIGGCDVPVRADGLCWPHYMRRWRYGDPLVMHRVQSYGDRRCAALGCERRAKARGYCVTHYSRVRRTGTCESPDMAEVLLERTRRVAGSCWQWVGSVGTLGYGSYGGKLAHRLVYELLAGPIPEALVLDHLCRNRACVNPAHLECVTISENVKRGAQARREGR